MDKTSDLVFSKLLFGFPVVIFQLSVQVQERGPKNHHFTGIIFQSLFIPPIPLNSDLNGPSSITICPFPERIFEVSIGERRRDSVKHLKSNNLDWLKTPRCLKWKFNTNTMIIGRISKYATTLRSKLSVASFVIFLLHL